MATKTKYKKPYLQPLIIIILYLILNIIIVMNGGVLAIVLEQSLGSGLSIGTSQQQQQQQHIQCEIIKNSMCSSMAYKSTRMPNFFHDTNQIEASQRALQLQELVSSGCSQHVHAYLCELLFPVCLEHGQEAMKRFEIYPCRSFCRQVKDDCEHVIVNLIDRLAGILGGPEAANNLPIARGFNCNLLPFESNGGNGTLRGPCHEIPESTSITNQQQINRPQSTSNNNNVIKNNININNNNIDNNPYHPYEPESSQVPPYIADNSPIYRNVLDMDFTLNKQTSSNQVQNKQQQQQQGINFNGEQNGNKTASILTSFWARLQKINSSIPLYEVLSIITIICLILALNANRLYRLKSYLSLSSSASSSNNSSQSSSYHDQLENARKVSKSLIGASIGYPAIGGQHHRSISPSSSSRSLVLITTGGNNGNTHHQLISSEDKCPPLDKTQIPSQSLIHGLSQKTNINLRNGSTIDGNGTRQASRYLFTDNLQINKSAKQQNYPQNDKQLFDTLDSNHSSLHSTSNHYDYIRETYSGKDEHQQLHTNILLSSPSHQILLLDHQQQQQNQGSPNIDFDRSSNSTRNSHQSNYRSISNKIQGSPFNRPTNQFGYHGQQMGPLQPNYADPDYNLDLTLNGGSSSYATRSIQRSKIRTSSKRAHSAAMHGFGSSSRQQLFGPTSMNSPGSSLAGDLSSDLLASQQNGINNNNCGSNNSTPRSKVRRIN